VRNALARGKRGGLTAAAGAAVGNTTQATIAGLGVAVLLREWPMAMTAVQIAGGLYLLRLAAKSLAASGNVNREKSTGKNSFLEGLTVNLLNPAITTFYVAVVPTFVPRGASGRYYAALASAHIAIAFVCHAFWTAAFDALRRHVEKPGVKRALDLITTLVLIGLAVSILVRSMSGATPA